jgi:hypothetical protein
MNWELFYLICFIVGFVFSTLSFLTGTLHLHLPTNWHVHVGNNGFHSEGVGTFFNSFTLMAFLTWFGGMGYLLTRYSSIWTGLALLVATGAGLLGAAIVFWFFAKILLKHDVGIDAAEYDMIGVLGRVSSSIRSQGTGEMLFEQVGTRRSCGVRSEDGSPIAKGTEVVVTRYERGIAYVRAWDEISGEAEAEAGESSKR